MVNQRIKQNICKHKILPQFPTALSLRKIIEFEIVGSISFETLYFLVLESDSQNYHTHGGLKG